MIKGMLLPAQVFMNALCKYELQRRPNHEKTLRFISFFSLLRILYLQPLNQENLLTWQTYKSPRTM